VLAQSYKDIEIIIVNDGSTDGSGALLERHYSHVANVRVISQENGGLSAARNAGLDCSDSEFVAFLDSDDYVDSEMYAELISHMEKYDAQISSCASRDVSESGEVISRRKCDGVVVVLSPSGAFLGLENQRYVRFEVWNKVFRRDLIGDVKFKDRQIYEDVYFEGQMFFLMTRMVHVDVAYHNYVTSREGNTVSRFTERHMDVLDEFDGLVKRLELAGMGEEAYAVRIRSCWFMLSLYQAAYQNGSCSHCRRIYGRFCAVYSSLNRAVRFNFILFRRSPMLWRMARSIRSRFFAWV
jgi:glycosyltransferase involved in cell wall biosynthesis